MKHIGYSCLIALASLASACDGQSSTSPTAAVQAATVATPATHAPAPSPNAVLAAIYKKDSGGATSYDAGNGRWATYWYSYAFVLNDRHYLAGFAYDAPTASDDTGQASAPGNKVDLAVATYVNSATGTWSLAGAERDIGEFGGSGKGNEIDEARKPQSYAMANGTLLLAVPDWYLAEGTRINSYELFLFDPTTVQAHGKRWNYLGDIDAGEDNSAACDEADGGKIACVKSIGSLSFAPQNGQAMPSVHVAMSGTRIGNTGKTQTLGAADGIDYRYDATKARYISSKP